MIPFWSDSESASVGEETLGERTLGEDVSKGRGILIGGLVMVVVLIGEDGSLLGRDFLFGLLVAAFFPFYCHRSKNDTFNNTKDTFCYSWVIYFPHITYFDRFCGRRKKLILICIFKALIHTCSCEPSSLYAFSQCKHI